MERKALGRPRKFDMDRAIQGAMDVFWSDGYEQASLPDLLDGMGISRGSLYKAFHDKKALFLRVLDYYDQKEVEPAITLLSDSSIDDGLARIEKLLALVHGAIRAGDRRGCLLCTTAAGPACVDIDIAQNVERMLRRMRSGFETALASTPHILEFEEKTRQTMPDLLVNHYVGLRILSRSQVPIDMIEASSIAILGLLKKHGASE